MVELFNSPPDPPTTLLPLSSAHSARRATIKIVNENFSASFSIFSFVIDEESKIKRKDKKSRSFLRRRLRMALKVVYV